MLFRSDELREVRGAVTKMADALTKLSLLEERNMVVAQAIEKLAERLDKTDDKLNAVALELVKFEAKAEGMAKAMKFMWVAFGGGVTYIGAQLFKLAIA